MDFDFPAPRRLLVQQGASRRLPEFCRELHAKSVLLITDPGIDKLGLLDDVKAAFQQQGVALACFTQVSADPVDSIVLAACAHASEVNADCIIGFGGGSSMDVAKLVAKLRNADNTQQLADQIGRATWKEKGSQDV